MEHDNPQVAEKDKIIKQQMKTIAKQAKKTAFLQQYLSGLADNKGDTTPFKNELATLKREIRELRRQIKDKKLQNKT